MRIGTEEVGPSQGCRLGHGLRRVSLWAGESGVSRLGLQYAVMRELSAGDPRARAARDGANSAVSLKCDFRSEGSKALVGRRCIIASRALDQKYPWPIQ